MRDKGEQSLPDFIVIGPGRSGSTWIYKALHAHPEICMAKDTKETCFFDQNYDKGIGWYEDFFSHCKDSTVRGEVSNLYIYNDSVPERMYAEVPNVKLVTCLRDPIDRIRSAYQFRKRNETIDGSFASAIEKDDSLIGNNFYWKHLQKYFQYFDESQIKILFFEDLRDNPRSFLEDLYGFIEVDSHFEPDFVGEKINTSAKPRFPLLGSISKKMANLLRRYEMYKTLNFLKWNSLARKIVLKKHNNEEKNSVIPDHLQRELEDIYSPDIEKLMDYTGRDLSHWMNH